MTTTTIVPTETQLQRSSGLHPELQQLYDRSCDWECKLSFEEVDESKNGDRRKHNLCECLKEGNEYMFPAKFHGLAAIEKLVTALKLSALKNYVGRGKKTCKGMFTVAFQRNCISSPSEHQKRVRCCTHARSTALHVDARAYNGIGTRPICN
ncbi:hypothetical protein IV203_032024 [Nitzschia inconspicua]|uniref:Uncharacterized protein n=1 Tax=Nitzschia inconspicua TaxID=303405 RepID=A0A9K3Q357_9STRA|nr:hypothetical protein IV203_032024 [Nitzschia inconspicua]